MSGNVVPFGKYKGQPVEEMLADHEYMTWVEAQPWFRDRYLHLLSRRDADAASRTPVHNRLQTLFLDQEYRLAFTHMVMPKAAVDRIQKALNQRVTYIDAALRQPNASAFVEVAAALATAAVHWSSTVSFESGGGDVVIEARAQTPFPQARWTYGNFPQEILPVIENEAIYLGYDNDRLKLVIEIKPSVSDEYPAVLRQMKRNNSRYLFIGSYAGEGANESEFVAIFAASDKRVVFKREIDRAVAQVMLAKLDAAGIGLTLQPSGKMTLTPGPQPAPELLASARVHRDAIIALLLNRTLGEAEATQSVQDDTL